jgi:hypothetical protein
MLADYKSHIEQGIVQGVEQEKQCIALFIFCEYEASVMCKVCIHESHWTNR